MTNRTRLLALSLLLAPAAIQAQGNVSAAATALGGSYTTLARGFNATAWNPANLGLPGNPKFSMALGGMINAGSGPITLADLSDYSGTVVPLAVREQWLQKVIDNNGQDLGGALDVGPLAMSFGPIAVSATTTVRSDGVLPPAVVSLMMFGNAGRTGVPEDYELRDMKLDANATSTIAVAYGRKLPVVPIGSLTVGVTGKYIIGHGMASMRDNGSTITSSPVAINLDAPTVVTDTAEWQNGRGFGFDVGATWQVGALRTSAVIHDLVSTFKWDTDNLYYLPAKATFEQGSSSEMTDSLLPLSSAPPALQAELRSRIESATPTPTLALGASWTGIRRLTLVGEVRQRFGDGLDLGPDTQIGVGAELRLIPFVPLRAGVTTLGEGMRLSGGLGLEFGVFNLQVGGQLLQASGRNESAFGFTMSLFGR